MTRWKSQMLGKDPKHRWVLDSLSQKESRIERELQRGMADFLRLWELTT